MLWTSGRDAGRPILSVQPLQHDTIHFYVGSILAGAFQDFNLDVLHIRASGEIDGAVLPVRLLGGVEAEGSRLIPGRYPYFEKSVTSVSLVQQEVEIVSASFPA